MRVGPVHACLCYVRGGRGADRTRNNDHSSSSNLDSQVCTHIRPHTPSILNGAPHARENRSEQGVETDEGGDRGICVGGRHLHACKNACVCVVVCMCVDEGLEERGEEGV